MPDDRERLTVGNAWDCYSTALLARSLPAVLEYNGQLPYWRDEFWSLADAVLAMQRRGIAVDIIERDRMKRDIGRELGEVDCSLIRLAICPSINTNSDTQLRRWLFGGDRTKAEPGAEVAIAKPRRKKDPTPTVRCLGLRPAGKTDGGLWSVDRDNLMRVLRDLRKMDQPHVPILHALLHRSRLNKLLEYLDFPVRQMDDGSHRIYPLVKMTGTKTMRLAYSSPPIHSWADEIRSMVVASPGNVLVACDYSAIESRIFAWLTDDQGDMERFANMDAAATAADRELWDIHVNTAKELFGLDALPADKRKAYRNHAKSVRYGIFQYGGEPESAKTKTFCPCPKCAHLMPDTLSLTPAELRNTTERWFRRHPNVKLWRNNMLRNFQGPHASRSIRLPSGLPTYFFKPWSAELWREVWNRPIQHTAAWIIGRAQRRLHELGAPIVLQHHDSLVFDVPAHQAALAARQAKLVMEQPVAEMGGMRFPVEVTMGPSWAALKPVADANPDPNPDAIVSGDDEST